MQRLRRLFLRAPLLDAIPGGVLRVLGSPVRLRLLPPRRLTLRPATGALPRSYSWVGTEPMVADGTRSLPGRWHRESSSPCCCLGFRWRFSSDCLGNFSKAHLGNFSRAPKFVVVSSRQHLKGAYNRARKHAAGHSPVWSPGVHVESRRPKSPPWRPPESTGPHAKSFVFGGNACK